MKTLRNFSIHEGCESVADVHSSLHSYLTSPQTAFRNTFWYVEEETALLSNSNFHMICFECSIRLRQAGGQRVWRRAEAVILYPLQTSYSAIVFTQNILQFSIVSILHFTQLSFVYLGLLLFDLEAQIKQVLKKHICY
jgi:hypothetical protein